MVSFNDFKRIDLRIAKVLSAEPHPSADRLYVLKVDLGTEKKQLVAGLKGHYPLEALVGKCVVVVSNLQPAVLRGVESQGMLLAAQDGEKVVILIPEKEVSPGSRVL
jgi:methionyl-tRNA synthetase